MKDSESAKLWQDARPATAKKFSGNTLTKELYLEKPGFQQSELDELAKSLAER